MRSSSGISSRVLRLNESPSEKEGKFGFTGDKCHKLLVSLNESPSEKEGKSGGLAGGGHRVSPPQ